MLVFRRSAAALGALAAASLVASAGQTASAAPAHTGPAGTASAVTARVALDVGLLHGLDVPVDVSLNAVHAPASADGSMLKATVSGVEGGEQTLVDATVGHSSAVVDKDGARASADLVTAKVKVPGLLLSDLVTLDEVKASAVCPVHGKPTASVDVLGAVSVLGKKVSLTAAGPTRVAVPGLGVVDVEFSAKTVTSHSAAATALEVGLVLNPGRLDVVRVAGTVELAAVRCDLGGRDRGGNPPTGHPTGRPTTGTGTPTPTDTATSTGTGAATGGATTAPAVPAGATGAPSATSGPAPARTDLAVTGGGSETPVLAAAAAVLIGAGTGAVLLTRRRRRSA